MRTSRYAAGVISAATTVIACLYTGFAAPAYAADRAAPKAQRSVDCRYQMLATPDDSSLRHALFPVDDVFRPLLANMKEPRFFASYRWVDYDLALDGPGGDEAFNGAVVGFGESFGLWTLRAERSCQGVQVGFFGGVFSQFNLDTPSANLLNSDFQFGVQTSARLGWLSARLRIYHQSSHLGDEFLIDNPDFARTDLNFEALDMLVSAAASWWRVYAGGGYLVHRFPESLRRGKLQAGVEARSSGWSSESFLPSGTWTWVAGVDATSYEVRDWGLTVSAKAGLELAGSRLHRRIRTHVVFLSGYIPFGQFFGERQLTELGVEAQFEF